MAIINLDFYSGTDDYSDGYIEDILLDFYKYNADIPSDLTQQQKYAFFYHTSIIRENILNWYPFSPECTILEIGSGCGALTGLLCQKAIKVVSVELSKKRASINYERNKNYSNLEIIVGNLNDIMLPTYFDYIILNGVLEYASAFTKTLSPYMDFLVKIKKKLSKEGKLLIGIENRFGIKYFSGSKEDHTNNFFIGLNKYDGNPAVKTFTKSEITDLLEQSGLSHHKFYYPYPDYKFPIEIYSDENINIGKYGRYNFKPEIEKIQLFDDKKVMDTLCQEKVMDIFSNSFFIEASNDSLSTINSVLYAKMNTSRREKFRTNTIILKKDGKKKVYKTACGINAYNHLQQIRQNELESMEQVNYLQGELEDGSIVYPYIDLDTVDYKILNLLKNNDYNAITELIHLIYKTLFAKATLEENIYSKEFKTYFGDCEIKRNFRCVKNYNIDIIFDNIFWDNGSLLFIDREWVCPFYVPSEFIIWRTLNEFYNKYEEFDEFLNFNNLLSEYNIDEECRDVFKMWAIHFAECFVSDNTAVKFQGTIYPFSMDNWLKDYERKNTYYSNLYFDIGNGFTELDVVTKKYNFSSDKNIIILNFTLLEADKIIHLRWDPIEERMCICKILSCTCNKNDMDLYSINSEEWNPEIFLTIDPQYCLNLPATFQANICIKFEIELLDERKITKLLNKKEDWIIEKTKEQINILKEKETACIEYQNTIQLLIQKAETNEISYGEKNQILLSQNVELQEHVTKEKNQISHLLQHINILKAVKETLDSENKELVNAVSYLTSTNMQLENSIQDLNRILEEQMKEKVVLKTEPAVGNTGGTQRFLNLLRGKRNGSNKRGSNKSD